MNSQKTRTFLFFLIGAVLGGMVMYFCSNYTVEKKNNILISQTSNSNQQNNQENFDKASSSQSVSKSGNIDELTNEKTIIDYVKQNHKLPDYYLTKSEARNLGWNASAGNLCDVLPGRAIGGDKFSNREKQLPKGEQYFEADVNYKCGNRNADRIVFTKNGEVWVTHNHYKSFEKQ